MVGIGNLIIGATSASLSLEVMRERDCGFLIGLLYK